MTARRRLRSLTRALRRNEVRAEALCELAGHDPLLRRLLLSRRLSPLAAAVVTLLLGFGVFALWYVVVVSDGDLAASVSGLSVFPTGAIGDSLLLTVGGALTVLAYGGLADMVVNAPRAVQGGVPVSSRTGDAPARLRADLARGTLAWAPAALAAGIVIAYHWPWLASAEFWAVPTADEVLTLYAPGVYHAFFMAGVIWWALAFVIRLTVVCVRLLPLAARSDDPGAGFVAAVNDTYWYTLGLVTLYTAFITLLSADDFWLNADRTVSTTAGAVALGALLAVVLWVALLVVRARWLVPMRRHAPEGRDLA